MKYWAGGGSGEPAKAKRKPKPRPISAPAAYRKLIASMRAKLDLLAVKTPRTWPTGGSAVADLAWIDERLADMLDKPQDISTKGATNESAN